MTTTAASVSNGGPDLPFVVPPPQAGHPPFADFAWREFIALMWPAKLDVSGLPLRGEPDRTLAFGDLTRPRVWETWKADWELVGFKGGPKPAPTPWDSWKVEGGGSPCAQMNLAPSAKMIVMATKMDTVIRGINQAFTGPLIDQARNYVRYEIRINRSEYETAVGKGWFVRANQPATFQFEMSRPGTYGAIELKAAWREVPDGFDASAYYTEPAVIVDPGPTPTCRKAKIALVGFHIAHKTAPFAEWVWSTFENIHNVPGPAAPAGPYSFNNGTAVPPSPNGFDRIAKRLNLTKPLPPSSDPMRNPIQVTRFTPVPSEIDLANVQFRGSAPVKGTVWENYVAVNNQWPTAPGTFVPGGTYPGQAGSPFPLDHVANTTMETYFQNRMAGSGLGSCMECHFTAAGQDFSFVMTDAWQPSGPVPAAAPQPTGQQKIKPALDKVFQ